VVSMSRNESTGVIVADSTASAATIFRRTATTGAALDLGESWKAAAFTPAGALLLMNQDGDIATRVSGSNAFPFIRSPTVGFNDVVSASSFALAIGNSGRAYRVNATGYTSVASATAANLNAACRVSDTELYVVGNSGVLRQYNGTSISSMTSPTTQDLNGVSCPSTQTAVACGAAGTVLKLTGGTWAAATPAFPNASATLSSCWMTAAGTLYVAGDGVFAKLEAGAWSTLAGQSKLDNLQYLGPTEIYGTSDNKVVRFDGTNWTTVFTAPVPLLGGASMTGRAVFVGAGGTIVEGQ
jgi:hypothetical protein